MFGPEAGLFRGEGKFMPEVNMVETDKALEVTVELPGMKAEDVKVEIRENALWISGEKKEEKEETNKTYHRIERRAGMFRRVLPLPVEVTDRGVEAHFVEGVLRITLPKAERATPKPIPIKG
jgi:HSP20 family protein